MSETSLERPYETSLFSLGTVLLRERWRIMWWGVAGGFIAALSTISSAKLYKASASFVSEGTNSNSQLVNLAGQFGLSFSGSNPSLSPAFYVALLKSHIVLSAVVNDTFIVQEQGHKRIAFVDLFKVKGESAAIREELGVKVLGDLIDPQVDLKTGIVSLSITTRWPGVSYQIVHALISRVDDYNLRTRQSQAVAESRFLKERVASESISLRSAEDRLEKFLQGNRELANSPQLRFENDRLQRQVTLQQQVYTSLTQAYEDAQIRAVRNTPAITMVETPYVPAIALPRGRLKRSILGVFIGSFLGVLLIIAGGVLSRARESENQEVSEFFREFHVFRMGLLRPLTRRRKRMR